MKPMYWIVGALAFLLVKRPKKTSKQQTPQMLAAGQQVSAAALSLSTQSNLPGLSVTGQHAAIHRLLQGSTLPRPVSRVSGLAPFNLSTNKPDARQICILYLLDPRFELVDPRVGTVYVSDLFQEVKKKDPKLENSILKASIQDQLAMALELLPNDKIMDFTFYTLYSAEAELVSLGGTGYKKYRDYVEALSEGKTDKALPRLGAAGDDFLRRIKEDPSLNALVTEVTSAATIYRDAKWMRDSPTDHASTAFLSAKARATHASTASRQEASTSLSKDEKKRLDQYVQERRRLEQRIQEAIREQGDGELLGLHAYPYSNRDEDLVEFMGTPDEIRRDFERQFKPSALKKLEKQEGSVYRTSIEDALQAILQRAK